MKLASIFTLACAFPLTLTGAAAPNAAQETASSPTAIAEHHLGSLFPKRCDLYVEAPGLAQLFDAGLDAPLLQRIEGSELLRSALSESGANLQGLIAFGSLWLGRPLLATAADLSRNGLALGVDFSGQEPAVLFALDAANEGVLDFALERVFDALEKRFETPGAFDEPHRRTHGNDVWKLGDEGFIGRNGTRLLVANDRSLFQDALALSQAEVPGGLAASPSFARSRASCPEGSLLYAHVELEQLEGRSAKTAAGIKNLRQLPAQPAVQFLLGDVFARIGRADTLTASLVPNGPHLEFALVASGTDARTALAPSAPPPYERSGSRIASAFLYRDLAAIVGSRSELFAARDLPAFARALTELSPLFGGIDIEQELLPHMGPWIEILVDPIPFEDSEMPETVFPAAALVAELEDPAAGDSLIAAFQTVVSLRNVEAGNRERPTHRLSLAFEGEVPLYRALLPKPRPEEGIDAIYNLQPACAVVDNHFILGTHESLVRELVRARPKSSNRRRSASETIQIDAAAVADSLAANREALIANKVVSDGVSFEEAEGEIDGLIGLSRLLGAVDFSIEHLASGDSSGTVQVLLTSRQKSERHAR